MHIGSADIDRLCLFFCKLLRDTDKLGISYTNSRT